MRINIFFTAAFLVLLSSCTPKYRNVIIPAPLHIEQLKGSCVAAAEPSVEICDSLGEEAYVLEITSEGISITAGSETGVFYAQQSLLQLRRTYYNRIPSQRIVDEPRFRYRGAHLDVSRHFRSVDFIRKQLRMFASLKLNRFHLHLVDGAGWRMETESYPLLHEVAAWRPEAYYYDWIAAGKYFCREDYPGAYGGYYTKDELRDLVAFADSLHITIIPEIEMFGHSEEVTAVYPEVSCLKAEDTADGKWHEGCPVLCIGKEETFEFLEKVLDEVMEIFPSEYIHIGGDEADKRFWAACPDCRVRMKAEGLKDVDELQSYGIKRIEAYLNAHGRHIIGWDEILEGGLAPEATVMSWRGTAGGEVAAAAGHDVIMTPGEYCYFDKCQGDPTTEPVGFGGNLSIRKVYGYDPAPDSMPGREHVLGVQANLWGELLLTDEHAEHMYYPRLYALSEIAWSSRSCLDYDDFYKRADRFNICARRDDYHPFDLRQTRDNRDGFGVEQPNLAKGCKVEYGTQYWPSYAASGDGALTDGLVGGWDFHDEWQGWLNRDAVATVDLGDEVEFHSLSTTFHQWRTVEIMLPCEVIYEVSNDGENFSQLASIPYEIQWDEMHPQYRPYTWEGTARARYIRMTGKINPDRWGWLFADEIFVR